MAKVKAEELDALGAFGGGEPVFVKDKTLASNIPGEPIAGKFGPQFKVMAVKEDGTEKPYWINLAKGVKPKKKMDLVIFVAARDFDDTIDGRQVTIKEGETRVKAM